MFDIRKVVLPDHRQTAAGRRCTTSPGFLQGQDINRPRRRQAAAAMAFWRPCINGDDGPGQIEYSYHSGIAVIAFDLPSTTCWRASAILSGPALTRCKGPFAGRGVEGMARVLPAMQPKRPGRGDDESLHFSVVETAVGG